MMITINTSARVRACAIALFFVCLDISTVHGQQQVLQCKACMLEDSGSRAVKDVKPFSVLGVSALNMYYRRGSPTLTVGTVDGLDRPLFVFDWGNGAVNSVEAISWKATQLADYVTGRHKRVMVDYSNYTAAFRFDPWYEEYTIRAYYGFNVSSVFCFSDSVVMRRGDEFVRFTGLICGAIIQNTGWLFDQLTLYGLASEQLKDRKYWSSYVLLLEKLYGIEYHEDVVPLQAGFKNTVRKYFLFMGDPVYITGDPELFAYNTLVKLQALETQGLVEEAQQLAFDTTLLVVGLYNHYYIAKGEGIAHWLSIITFARSQLRGQFLSSLSVDDIFTHARIGPVVSYIYATMSEIYKNAKERPSDPAADFDMHFTEQEIDFMDEHLGFAFEGFSALLPPYMRDNGSKTNECEGMNPHQVLGYILEKIQIWSTPMQARFNKARHEAALSADIRNLGYWRLCRDLPRFRYDELTQFYRLVRVYEDKGATIENAVAWAETKIRGKYRQMYGFVPQGMFTSHPALKSLISLCAVAITVLGMKDVGLDKAISVVSNAMRFHTFVKGADLASSIIEGLEVVFTTLKTVYSTGSFDCLLDCSKEMSDTGKEVAVIMTELENMDVYVLDFPTSWLQARVSRLNEIHDRYLIWKARYPHRKVELEALAANCKLVIDVAQNKFKALSTRPRPFCFLLGGGSSVGKTSLISMILAQYISDAPMHPEMSIRNEGKGLDPNAYTYATLGNTTDEYDTEITNSQWGLIFDDVAVVSPKVGTGAHIAALIQKLIRVINVAPASTQQAALDKKGKIFYNHSLIGITTNSPDMFVSQIAAHPSAVFRRIDVYVDVVVKDQFVKKGTTQLDPAKVNQYSPYSDAKGQIVDAWDFTLYKYIVVHGGKPVRQDILKTGSTREFLKTLSDMWFEHAQCESQTLRSCGSGSFTICKKCYMVGADIDGICRHPDCRNPGVPSGSASMFGLIMKLVVEYKVEWVGYYLTFCASISTVLFEELAKRGTGGFWIPLFEYFAYVYAFSGGRYMFLFRLIPLSLHYYWMSLPLWEALLQHYTYNVCVYAVERKFPNLLLASFIPLLKENLHCVFFFVYVVLRVEALQGIYYWVLDNRIFVEQVCIAIYVIYMIMERKLMNSEIVHRIRVPICSAVEDTMIWTWDRCVDYYMRWFSRHRKYVLFFTAVLAAVIVLKGVRVMSGMQSFKPQGFGSEPAKGKDIWASVPVQTPIHSPGTHPTMFASKLVMNTVEIVFKHEGVDRKIKALAIAGSSFLMTKHEATVLYGKDSTRICLRQPDRVNVNDFVEDFDIVRYRVGRSNSALFIDRSNFNFHPHKDLCVLTVNTTPFPSLCNYFLQTVQPNINDARSVGVNDTEHQVYRYPRLRHVINIPVMGQGEQNAYLGHAFTSEDEKITSAVGFCGNVLFNAVRGCNAIYGIHNSGHPSDGACAFVPVLREDIDYFLRNSPIVDVQDMLGEVYPAEAGQLVHQRDKQSFHRKNAFGFCEPTDGSPCRLWLTVGNACQIELKSKFKESRFVDWWLESKIRVGSEFRRIMDTVMCVPRLPASWRWLPQYRFAEIVTQAKEFISPSVVRGLANKYLDRLLSNSQFVERLRHARPLELDEAVNGITGARFIKSLNMQSSAGYPYNKPKKDICCLSGFKYLLPQYVIDRFGVMVSRLKQGKIAGIIFTASVKDEPVSAKKIHSDIQDKRPSEVPKDELDAAITAGFGKIRVFQAISLEGCLIIRTFYLMLVSLLQEFRFLSCIAVGLNCFSCEWDELYAHMTPDWGDGHNFICGDFSNYDQRISTEFLKNAWWILRELWMHTDYFHRLDAAARDAFVRMLDVISVEMSNPLSWFWGDLVHLQGGNASGHPLTVIINGIVNYMYMLYAFTQIYPDKDFDEMVRFMTYGDDNVLTVHPSCPEFNQIEITRVLAEVGIVYTSSDKKIVSDPYEKELVFLKRTWKKSSYEIDGERYDYYACPLDWSSFSKTLSVEKKMGADNDVRMISVLLSLSLEMMQYGPATHNSFLSEAQRFLDEHKLNGTYQECVKGGWMTMETYLRNRKMRSDVIPSLSPMFSDSETD